MQNKSIRVIGNVMSYNAQRLFDSCINKKVFNLFFCQRRVKSACRVCSLRGDVLLGCAAIGDGQNHALY